MTTNLQFIIRASGHQHGGNCYAVLQDEDEAMTHAELYVSEGYSKVELTLVPVERYTAAEQVIAAFVTAQKHIRVR